MRPAPLPYPPDRALLRAFTTLVVLSAPATGLAQSAAPPSPSRYVTTTATLRLREEAWDWFDDSAEGRYAFTGGLLRLGIEGWHRWIAWKGELVAPALLGLPTDAVQAAPAGQLGLGAAYAAANNGATHVVKVLPRQAWVRLGPADRAQLTVGRMDFSDGAEFVPRHATLAAVRAQRANQRLIGPFGFTHVQRGFDGARLSMDRPGRNLTVLAARPTVGAFSAQGSAPLALDLGYASGSREFVVGKARVDARALASWFADRRGITAVDARPAAVRAADKARIGLWTLGGHVTAAIPVAAGTVDLFAWWVMQRGDWGNQLHRASAAALEAGVQLAQWPGRPWLRAGHVVSSGDDDPLDATHGTFFQLLPTPRPYARFPFYNMMNLQETFASAQWRLAPVVTVRLGASVLALGSSRDLWYTGGGPFDGQAFGYAGRPSQGRRSLGRVADVSLEWRPTKRAGFELYAAQATGADVITRTYPGGGRGHLLYLETTLSK